MLKRLPILFLFIAAVLPAQTQLGTFANGIYHHNLTGIEFAVPAEWVIASQGPSSEQSAQVIKLRDAVSNAIGTVWLKSRIAAPADIQALMSERLDVKATQRNNFEGYKYRTDSVRNTTIGGRPALSAVAIMSAMDKRWWSIQPGSTVRKAAWFSPDAYRPPSWRISRCASIL